MQRAELEARVSEVEAERAAAVSAHEAAVSLASSERELVRASLQAEGDAAVARLRGHALCPAVNRMSKTNV